MSLREPRKGWLQLEDGKWIHTASGLFETVATRRLKAPAGTKLDCPKADDACKAGQYRKGLVAGDSVYCRSGRFAAVVSDPNGDLYGICSGAT